MAILPTPEPTPTPAPTPPPLPEPKPVREPDPDRLPDEAPVPNPDENDAPLKIGPKTSNPGISPSGLGGSDRRDARSRSPSSSWRPVSAHCAAIERVALRRRGMMME
ncbi:MAG: hypothetical protein EOR81_15180 [Mesorhizobium sp.]|nr:MAG: hypothetical protein EOR81_15180 [Mesorhizobium sp.]